MQVCKWVNQKTKIWASPLGPRTFRGPDSGQGRRAVPVVPNVSPADRFWHDFAPQPKNGILGVRGLANCMDEDIIKTSSGSTKRACANTLFTHSESHTHTFPMKSQIQTFGCFDGFPHRQQVVSRDCFGKFAPSLNKTRFRRGGAAKTSVRRPANQHHPSKKTKAPPCRLNDFRGPSCSGSVLKKQHSGVFGGGRALGSEGRSFLEHLKKS